MNTVFDEKLIGQIEESTKRVRYYKNIVMTTSCPQKRMYFENLMLAEIEKASKFFSEICRARRNKPDDEYRQGKEFTLIELSNFDGTMGKPAYAAVNGVVYDMSEQLSWGGGTHFGLTAGRDLTSEFSRCHNKQEILSMLPKVGIIKPE